MKCVSQECGSEISGGAKFCPICGTAAPTPMTKCSSGHECIEGHKFCGECGEPMVKAVQQEFDEALDALVAMTKGASDEFSLPEFDDTDPDLNLQGAATPDDNGVLALDAGDLIKAVVSATKANGKNLFAALETLGTEVVAQRKLLGAMIKAQASTMSAFRALQDGKLATLEAAVSDIGATRNPRKAVVTPLVKSVATGDPAEPQEAPRGGVLLKAAIDAERNGMIKSLDVSVTEEMVNRGLDLNQIAGMNPGLASALTRQLSAGQTAH